MQLLVRGGRVVTPSFNANLDIEVVDGRIRGWHDPGSISGRAADQVIDAAGLLVLPGCIDPHVHSRDPGQRHKETFESSTAEAAVSGVTTLLEMPNAVPPVVDGDVFDGRVEYLAERANVDFGLWGMAVGSSFGEGLRELAAAGAVGVKVFWGFAFDRAEQRLVYSMPDEPSPDIVPPLDNAGMFALLEDAAEHGLLVGVHCEDRSLLELAQSRHGGYDTYEELGRCRSVAAETTSVAILAELAAETGADVHVLHVSSRRALEVVEGAQRRGISMTAETCPHYLMLTGDDYSRVGPAMKIYPPVRGTDDREALRRGVVSGVVASIGSDHAPHAPEERAGPLNKQPAGGRGVHAMVPVMLDAVNRGWLGLADVVACLSERTARLYGLHPRKGALLPGSDADLTIVDMDRPWTLSADAVAARRATDPWVGTKGRGCAVATVVRGVVVARNGELEVEGAGRWVARPPRQPA